MLLFATMPALQNLQKLIRKTTRRKCNYADGWLGCLPMSAVPASSTAADTSNSHTATIPPAAWSQLQAVGLSEPHIGLTKLKAATSMHVRMMRLSGLHVQLLPLPPS